MQRVVPPAVAVEVPVVEPRSVPWQVQAVPVITVVLRRAVRAMQHLAGQVVPPAQPVLQELNGMLVMALVAAVVASLALEIVRSASLEVIMALVAVVVAVLAEIVQVLLAVREEMAVLA